MRCCAAKGGGGRGQLAKGRQSKSQGGRMLGSVGQVTVSQSVSQNRYAEVRVMGTYISFMGKWKDPD